MKAARILTVCGILMMAVSTIARGAEIGDAVGPLKLLNSAGVEISLEHYDKYAATAVLFLSSRCPATEKAIADINALYQRYRYKSILFVGVCSNSAETSDELRDFAQKRGMIFSIFRDPKGEVAKTLGAKATPEFALLDNEGKLVFRGGLETNDGRQIFAGVMERLLAAKPAAPVNTPSERTPIDRPGSKIKREDSFGTIAFSSELIFEKLPGASAFHCSTIAEAPNGDLLCLWYGGSYESADDQVLFLSRRKPGERIWSTPEVLIADSLKPPGNGLLFTDGKSRVWVVWCRMESTQPIQRGEGWDRCKLMYRTSNDNGVTWTADKPMLADDELVRRQGIWFVPRNPPIVTKNGATILGLEAVIQGATTSKTGEKLDQQGSVFLISNDDGDSWRRGGFTTAGSQPALAERSDGSVMAMLRVAPQIAEITSTDNGQSWSEGKATKLANPDSGISMQKLANGHMVIVYNDSPLFRTPLSIARSIDDGATWEAPMALESNPGEYSYPCVIQTSDGKIHVTYTFRRYSIKHVELNEDWMVQIRRPN